MGKNTGKVASVRSLRKLGRSTQALPTRESRRVPPNRAPSLRARPTEFGSLIADETKKWGKVIRAANIKPE